MGFVRKTIGSLTGANDAADAASAAADVQRQAGENAIQLQRETLEQQRADLAPFRDIFTPELAQRIGQTAGNVNVAGINPLMQMGQIAPTIAPQGQIAPTISPEMVGQMGDITQDPTYRALADDAARRVFANQAARGKLGSGGTAESLQQRLVAMGDQLSTSRLNRELARRGQLVGEQQAQFGQQVAGRQQQVGEQQALFGQQLGGRQLQAGEQAQRFGQQLQLALTPQQQQFNQLLDLTRLGQASAAQQAAQAGASGANIGNLLTQVGNVRAAGITAPAAIQQQGIGSLLQLGGQLGASGAFDGLGGAIAGGAKSLGGAVAGLFSDYRLKENITYLKTHNGIPLFTFDYIDGPKNQTGTMAQLIQDDYPEAVEYVDGYMWVDYGKLPLWH